ncbi:MAG: AsmA-like C-terminal domain-containing protein [Desulfuromusa sp.]|jgi:uncharacterized protein involved in outer membrane biogenesis|nr:AsmA-like C-terminal domain-containing protein [Desulfuromusa sp.]
MDHSSVRDLVRVTCYVLILLATIAALFIVYLSQLDLNDYRHSLEQTMSSALKQQVQIGHSSLTFNRGLALALKDLQIGKNDAPLAEISKITATLKIAPLIKGQFILDQVQIDNPNITINLPFPDRPAKGTSQRLLDTLGISILTVHNADIKVFQKHEGKTRQILNLAHLNTVLRGWKPDKVGELVISGQLQEQGGRFIFETRLPSSRDPEIWRNEEQKAQLKITNFSTQKFPKLPDQNLPERLELNLNIQGVPATGTDFNSTIFSPDNNEQIFSLSGRWTSSSEQDAITRLDGELLGIPLKGEFYLIKQLEKYFLAGQFGAKNVKLTQKILRDWQIPNATKFLHGELGQLTIRVNDSWASSENLPVPPNIDAQISISNLNWDLPERKQLQELSVALYFKDEALGIKNGVFIYGSQHIDFSGKVHNLLLKPKVDCQFSLNTDINDLLPETKLPENWKISGKLPGSLRITGSLVKPDFLLQADLSAISIEGGSLFHKQQSDHSKFKLRGSLNGHQLQLDQASLSLNNAQITGHGYIGLSHEEPEFSFAADPINLQELKPFSPLLEKLQIQGEIEPELTRQQMGLQSILTLKNVGAHLTSIIGDLNKTTAKIYLDQHGFTFKELKTSLGQSKFIVSGIYSNWKNPELSLDLSSKKVRAQDLIFRNQQLTLYDLDGHLKINADGIYFSPVNVRLEDDTLATVNGSVSNFSHPEVALDIQADQVDVLDIINLFVGPNKTDFTEDNHEGPPVLIKAHAKQGVLGGLQFQNAEGTIRSEGRRLTIFPLKFDNGKGWCETRVEFDYKEDSAPLKVSGHIEGIDASVLHQDLFQRRGLVSGTLKGDFYLEGNPGNNRFWQEARGGAHLQIDNGTLRKFRSLARVFSLLNISQIFAGNLPDMDKEGMPFSLLDGSFQIEGGLVQTEDLKITSEAMNLSAVGSQKLSDDSLNFILGVMPLRTVDKIITSIPIAGWVLAGSDEALITAQFRIEGTSAEPTVTPIPIDSVSKTVFGIFKRTFGLPGKLAKDIGTIFEKEPPKKKDQ